MDVGTSLVQAYLHINGYFTAADYPLVETARDPAPRTLTDIDMLAVRFARPAGHESPPDRGKRPRKVAGPMVAQTDPALECPDHHTDMIVADLLRHGRAQAAHDHVVRMMLFASRGEQAPRGWHWIHLDHVFRFLDDYLRAQRDVLGSVDLHDPALSWLSLLHKCDLTLDHNKRTP